MEEKKRFDIICVGSATVDVFAKTEAELIRISTSHTEQELIAYPVGTKILIQDLRFEIGGGGTNTAVSFARLGLRTAYLGNVGSDNNSHMIMKCLQDENITFIGSRSGTPGYSVILDSIQEDRTILTYKGANDSLKLTRKQMKTLDAEWLYCTSMMGASFKTLCSIAKYARKHKIKLVYNPSTYQVKMGLRALMPLLRAAYALIFNKEEARILTGKPEADIPELMHFLHRLGIPIVAITDGKMGSYVSDRHSLMFSPPGKVKVVETTGAGDAFASAFVTGLIQGKDLADSMRMGMIQAESVIVHIGAKNTLLSGKEMEKRLKKDKHKVHRLH